ncbi:MAG: hypothetical protein ACP5F9_03655 [Thiomonas sp.]
MGTIKDKEETAELSAKVHHPTRKTDIPEMTRVARQVVTGLARS